MSCYIVTFEAAASATRTRLKDRLKGFQTYCPVHDHAWAIVTEQTAAQVRDALIPLLGPTDRLFVVRSGTEAAWFRSYGEKNDEWLKKNL